MQLTFRVYSQRQGHDDVYDLVHNGQGWDFSNRMVHRGQCNKDGSQFLYDALNQDSISYPNDLPDYLEALWDKIDGGNYSQQQAQDYLNNEITPWIIAIEKVNKPAFP